MLDDGQPPHSTSPHGNSSAMSDGRDGPALTMSGRTIQACDRCRFKKVRCDGAVPACGRCKQAGLDCLTTVKLTRKSYPRSYTESIEERLRTLEAETHRLKEDNNTKDRRIKELERANARLSIIGESNSSPPASNAPLSSRYDGHRHNKASTDEPLSREVGRMNRDRRGTGRFMGSSSGIFFVGSASQRLASLGNLSGNVSDDLLRVDIDDETTAFRPDVEDPTVSMDLPPREIAENYINIWFDFSRQIFPNLHRPSFMESVDRLYDTAMEKRDRAFLAQFFLVLALGCRHAVLTGESNDNMPSVKSTGDDSNWFSRSTKFQCDIIACNDLMAVQWQGLLTMWYLYTGKRSLAFQMTGKMTRLALELGLHRHTRRFHFDPLQTEMRKRVFWVSYMLDSFLSTIEGLPKSFRDQDIDVEPPSDVDDEFVNNQEYLLSLPGEPTRMVLFQSLVKVARILSKTLEILYTTTDRRRTITKIGTIDRLLDQWTHTLPDHLQLDPCLMTQPVDENVQIEPSLAFLHLVCLYTRFIAHRVAVSFPPTTPQYRPQLARCTEIARNLIYLNSHARRWLLAFDVNPGAHVYTIWSCGLMSLFGFSEVKAAGSSISGPDNDASKAVVGDCIQLLKYLVAAGKTGEQIRVYNLTEVMNATWPSDAVTETEALRLHPVAIMSPQRMTNLPSSYRRISSDMLQSTRTQDNEASNLLHEPAISDAQHHNPRITLFDGSQQSPPSLEDFNLDLAITSQSYNEFQLPTIDDSGNQESFLNPAFYHQETPELVWDDPIFNLTSVTPMDGPLLSSRRDTDASPNSSDQQTKKRPRLDS